jgi:predicted amidohydrolase YtcJ
MCVVNSKALQLARITRATEAPFGGAIHIDTERNEPSGLLQESAQQLLSRTYGAQDKAELRRALDIGSKAYLEAGVTSSQEAGIFHPNEFSVVQEAWQNHRLALRTYLMLRIPFLDAMEHMGIFTGFGDDRLKLGALKLLSDGSLIGRTAAVTQPFLEDPRPDNCGLPSWTQEELDELIWRGHSHGWQVAIHAIGDKAIEMCLDGFLKALQRMPRADHRHRLEHCGILRPDLIRRIKQMGVVPVGQPPFIIEFGDGFLTHLGFQRAQLTYPLRSFLDAEVPLAASSDSPVSDYRPLFGIQAAVDQRTASGQDYAPAERLTPEEAIALYTRAGAYASFDEDRKGTLASGKLADMVVLAADPRAVAPREIGQIRVLSTLIDGEMVYEAPIATARER